MLPPASTPEPFDAEVRVQHTVYKTADESFAVVLVQAPDGDTVTAAGPLAHLAAGTRARVAGRWQEHPKYGHQVQADLAYELDPDDAGGVRKYLLTIRHIGKSRAQALIERHGDAVLEHIDSDPEAAFAALRGLGRAAAQSAAESWRERRVLRDLYLLLAPHGAGWLAGPLRTRYGSEATALVRTQPYLLTEEHGVGFATADAIARANGTAIDAQARLRAATIHLLREAELRGHTYLTRDDLGTRAAKLVGTLEDSLLGALAADAVIALSNDQVALASTFDTEQAAAAKLARLAEGEPALRRPERPPRHPADLSEEQRAAVEAVFARPLSVVTGGPGTGKTTLVKAIVEQARAAKAEVALCAPTGRAARRLEDATGHPATTIHRLVEWQPGEGPLRNAGYPIECDLLVVDESSMLSLTVAAVLLAALAEDTHVVLIGDADQLPPVGAGKPFADVIESGRVPVARLTHVFRQAARSLIVQAAHAINRGEAPRTQATRSEVRDFFFIERTGDAGAADEIVALASERLPRHYDVDPIREVQVLAPIYRGAVGVDALNERLRAKLNPDGARCLDGPLRTGDKLIQTRNDYSTGLMNGQIVIALGEDEDGEELLVQSDAGERLAVPADRTHSLRPAYAISVHKSQGCEMPVVIVPVHTSHAVLLSRNLLYTAVTRARRACVLVGQRQAITRALRHADAFQRNSRLASLLAGEAV
ncbi:MAG: ATP-dependent RecD-like DNA helicase [Thermoleophilaceae bacterium]|nr:ATP-dependent RecD-like DNA helicase [Thermoleophilaceae bacterium]